MFCIKCGANNPDDGIFCYKCGNALFSPQQESPGFRGAPPPETSPSEPTTTPKSAPTRKNSRWVAAYGWFFIVTGLFLLLTGIITFFSGEDVTLPPIAFAHAKRMGLVSSIFQGSLFVATGLAIVWKKKIAVALVWVIVALSALGVLFRGLIPGDIIVWLLGLLLAIWFTKKTAEVPLAVKPVVGP